MEWGETVVVSGKEGQNEPKVMQHSRVWLECRMSGYNFMRQLV